MEWVEADRFLWLMRINQSKLVHPSGRFHVGKNAVEQLFLALAVHKDDRDAAPNVLLKDGFDQRGLAGAGHSAGNRLPGTNVIAPIERVSIRFVAN